eukprot:TRINITY_DN11396_c0_g1_i4.p1 TRINITY_DN11396_c0_g1~~TRINITY_DN11396_c0_g1_i4.p1  ORF type:complete len:480 (+),score=179.98 TRINITY_DN11396_c0_g1_i4:32-1441(+)
MSADLANLVARLEKVAARLEATGGVASGAPAGAAAGGDGSGNASVDGYDEIVNGSLQAFVAAGNALGGDIAPMIAKVEGAFQAQRAFIEIATKAKKPDQATMGTLLKPTSTLLQEVVEMRESNRRSEQFNHMSAISEGIPALGWVGVEPKPAPFVKEMKDAAQFYVNRVLKDFKDSDPKQCDFVKSWVALLDDLQAYIKRVHTTGLVWNKSGADASTFASAAAAAAPKPAAAAAPAVKKPALGGAPGADAKSGLFAALNKGGAVTSGLKRVDKSQMTHKNPELRATSVVKDVKPKAAAPARKFGADAKAKDPVFALNGKKWAVEYQKNNGEPLVIDNTEVKQTVYIYKCENCTIQVKGKVNSITVDGCKKVAIVFDNLVSAFEIVNCQRIQVQVTGLCNTVNIDKTDGVQVYLSKESIGAQIVTAKSSEMNISVPKGDDGEFTEMPVPEQYKTVYADGKLVTEPTDIAG